jgi:hypothetical protein
MGRVLAVAPASARTVIIKHGSAHPRARRALPHPVAAWEAASFAPIRIRPAYRANSSRRCLRSRRIESYQHG